MRSDVTTWGIRGMGLDAGALVVYGLIQLGIAAANVLLLLFVSILLASALEPMVGWLRERLPMGRVGTILIVYMPFFVVAIGMAFVVVPAAVNQGQRIVASLPPIFDEVRAWADGLRPVALSTSITALVDSVAAFFAPAPPPSPGEVVKVGTAVAEGAVFLFTMLAIVFFWLVAHARLQRYTLAFLPADRRAGARNAWNEIETRVGLWVRGQLILMGSIGAATGIAYTLLGLPGGPAARSHRRADGARDARRPGPGRHRDTRRGDDRGLRALAAGRGERLVEIGQRSRARPPAPPRSVIG